MGEQAKKIEEMPFEEALSELEQTVSSLESGEAKLEDSITAYERGVALKKRCEDLLSEAQTKIEKISIDKDGNLKVEPTTLEE